MLGTTRHCDVLTSSDQAAEVNGKIFERILVTENEASVSLFFLGLSRLLGAVRVGRLRMGSPSPAAGPVGSHGQHTPTQEHHACGEVHRPARPQPHTGHSPSTCLGVYRRPSRGKACSVTTFENVHKIPAGAGTCARGAMNTRLPAGLGLLGLWRGGGGRESLRQQPHTLGDRTLPARAGAQGEGAQAKMRQDPRYQASVNSVNGFTFSRSYG